MISGPPNTAIRPAYHDCSGVCAVTECHGTLLLIGDFTSYRSIPGTFVYRYTSAMFILINFFTVTFTHCVRLQLSLFLDYEPGRVRAPVQAGGGVCLRPGGRRGREGWGRSGAAPARGDGGDGGVAVDARSPEGRAVQRVLATGRRSQLQMWHRGHGQYHCCPV